WNRSAGSLACRVAITSASHAGTSGLISVSDRGTSSQTRRSTASVALARNGGRPAHIAYRTLPRLNRTATARESGFTLIELLVVIVVIGILATLVAPNVFRHISAAKDATARSQVEMLGAALDAYRLDIGRYPTTE